LTIPEGLRDVIGKRLSLLSTDCNQLLSVASVIEGVSLDILRGVANISEDAFVSALKEAVQMSVLEERSQLGSIRYRFTHAFFRQTMYEELIAPQRLKLHQQVARSLETQYAKRLEEHAAELAEHFSQSTDPADLTKAVSYGEMAARRAVSVYAYGEAARLLEQALKVQRVLNLDDKEKVCDLLIALGDILITVGEPQRAFNVDLQEAFSLAEAIGEKANAAHACSLAMVALLFYGAGVGSWSTPEAAQWLDRADRYAAPDSPARVCANIGIGEQKAFGGIFAHRFDMANEGFRFLIRNVELARRVNDTEAFWFAACARLNTVSAPQHAKARLDLAEELAQKARAGISPRLYGLGARLIGDVFLESGNRQRAEEFFSELKQTAERSGQVNLLIASKACDSFLATMDGNLEEAVAICQSILARGDQPGVAQWANLFGSIAGYQPLLLLGRFDEIAQLYKTAPIQVGIFSSRQDMKRPNPGEMGGSTPRYWIRRR
jgi:hypothetical protein